MDEYIEKQVFKKELIEKGFFPAIVKNVLENMPPAKVAPVKHGYWFDKGSLSCRCSECGCKSTKESRFCPNCGAKMDLE